MSTSRRKPNDDALVLALASGKSVAAAARQCGVCERTVYRRLADPAFRKQLTAVRADLVTRTAGKLTAAGLTAVQTLLDLQKADMPPAVRLGAAKAVLEAGVRLREGEQLEARVTELEAKLAEAERAAHTLPGRGR